MFYSLDCVKNKEAIAAQWITMWTGSIQMDNIVILSQSIFHLIGFISFFLRSFALCFLFHTFSCVE